MTDTTFSSGEFIVDVNNAFSMSPTKTQALTGVGAC